MSAQAGDQELRAQRASAVCRMYEGTLRSVASRAAWGRQCAAAAGVSEAEWGALTDFGAREAIIRRGRRILEGKP